MLSLQLISSAILVIAVIFFMWRLPTGSRFYGWAPPLALTSAWSGLFAAFGSIALWLMSQADAWLTTLFLVLDPAAIAFGTLVLWIYRGHRQETDDPDETIAMQTQQAKVGIGLGVFSVAIGYAYVFVHKPPDILPW